jgi:hypothetical protein
MNNDEPKPKLVCFIQSENERLNTVVMKLCAMLSEK